MHQTVEQAQQIERSSTGQIECPVYTLISYMSTIVDDRHRETHTETHRETPDGALAASCIDVKQRLPSTSLHQVQVHCLRHIRWWATSRLVRQPCVGVSPEKLNAVTSAIVGSQSLQATNRRLAGIPFN